MLHTSRGHELTLLGEVFMGHLVRDLKKQDGRRAVDAYIAEGERLAASIARGEIADANAANNRQLVEDSVAEDEDGNEAGEDDAHAS